jgi:hexosaminidase
MSEAVILLPQPKELNLSGGYLSLAPNKLITLDVPHPAALRFTARRAQQALAQEAGRNWEIVGGRGVPDEQVGLAISFDASLGEPEYRLGIAPERLEIAAGDEAGAFYGVMTLRQLLKTHGAKLPALTINDRPDMRRRGVMLDISRDKVPTVATLYDLVDRLASWKINELQLYTEHTFAYRRHPEVWAKASPLTAEEILALDTYCKERHIELVPNQNSFGHLHRWFEHDRYLPLAETETGATTPWGTKMAHPFSLSPAAPESLSFLEGLYAELLPNFSSQYFNVGCDETFDLGLGRSRALCEERGKGRVYLDFLLEIHKRATAHDRTMQFWGDIINQYPDLVPELPKDTVALEWGYEAEHDFAGKARLFGKSGIPFYVCPGTSSWTSLAGRTDNAMGNIQSAAQNGLEHGAVGLLNTDWGDMGHWQPLPVSYLGFAYGAALSWAYEKNLGIDLPAVLDAFAFEDRAGVMGNIAYGLGNAYKAPGVLVHNGSVLFWAYHRPLAEMKERWAGAVKQAEMDPRDDKALTERLQGTLDYIDGVMADLEDAHMKRPDGELIMREFDHAAAMLRHGARRLLFQLGEGDREELLEDLKAIERRHRALWLKRNRPGGLEDSAGRMTAARELFR